jgi:hypothetical protein
MNLRGFKLDPLREDPNLMRSEKTCCHLFWRRTCHCPFQFTCHPRIPHAPCIVGSAVSWHIDFLLHIDMHVYLYLIYTYIFIYIYNICTETVQVMWVAVLNNLIAGV